MPAGTGTTWATIHAKATSKEPVHKTGSSSLESIASAPQKFSDILKGLEHPTDPLAARRHGPVAAGSNPVGHGIRTLGDEIGTTAARTQAALSGYASGSFAPQVSGTGVGVGGAEGIGHISVKGGKVGFTGTPEQKRQAASLFMPHGGALGSAQEVLAAGPGMFLLANQLIHHPEGTAESVGKSIGSSVAGTVTAGHYGSKTNTKLDDLMNLWTIASLGAGGAARVGEMASADSLKGVAKAALTRAPQEARVLHVGEGEHARDIYAPASRNAASALLQRHVFDKLLQKSINTGSTDLGSVMLRKFGSPEARVARIARQHLRVENEVGHAPAIELSHLGQGVTRRVAKGKLGGLTAPQQHAVFIHSLGHTPETFAKASENAIAGSEGLGKLEGVDPAVIRANHEKLHALTKMSAEYVDAHGNILHPKVKQGVEAVARAIGSREKMRGMTDEEIHHALGSRWYAVQHLAEMNGKSLHQELSALMKTGGPEAESRIAEIHQAFESKGAEVRQKGATYLPQSPETKPLARAKQVVTRRAGSYGFAPPHEEQTYAQMGHLFNKGDYRTAAIPLAQHAFGKQHHLETMKGLHEMMLALSKKTPEEVGHHEPMAIRVSGPPSEELKRYFNEIHPGDMSESDAKNAMGRWNQMFPGKAPQGEDVRWLHPDIAAVFKPHQIGDTAKQFNRFTQLVRSQRFLNPKYATWNVQNAAVGAVQQGAMMPANMFRYARVVKKLDPETYSKIESAVGAGMSKSLGAPGDAKYVQHLASFWHHVNDHGYRMLSFVHEARRNGIHTAEQMKELMNSDAPKMAAKRHQVLQDANKEAIDYWMTPKERATIRNVMAYWSWTRGASMWALRAMKEHPVFGQLEMEAGRRGKKYIDDFYAKHGGSVPPNLEGSYPSHLGPIDMEAMNTPSTLAQTAEQVDGLFNPKAAKYTSSILGSASPPVKALVELGTGLSHGHLPKTGSIFGQTAHDLGSTILPLQVLKTIAGHGPPKTGTAPSGIIPMLEKWAGSPLEQGVNYDSEANLGSSINTSSLRGGSQVQAQAKASIQQVNQLAKKTKLDPGERQAYVKFFTNKAILGSLIATAATKDGAVSDKTKTTDQALSFKNPADYFIAYATAAARITGDKNLLKEGQAIVKQVMDDKTHTDEQKATVLYKTAQKMWRKVNPPTIQSAFYSRMDAAGLGG